jgi:hypothetical protein
LNAEGISERSNPVPRWLAAAICGVALSLGWGLRGQFGGPRGAMVPGALVAMALALVARRRLSVAQFWAVAATGAIGFSIGAEDTYMQTVGRIAHGDSVPWCYFGLLLKGGVWGGLGGLFIGSALGRKRYTLLQLVMAFNIALAISFVGFRLINEPRLLYFSGGDPAHHVKPKTEVWAGLWCLYLALLALAARVGDRSAVRLSLYGALGCGAGFVLGVFACTTGQALFGKATQSWMDWWKVAECGFGLVGGLVMGWGWSGMEQEPPLPAPKPPLPTPLPLTMIVLTLDLLLLFYVLDITDDVVGWVGEAPFAFAALAMILLVLRYPLLQLLFGVTIPIVLTAWNMQAYWLNEQHLMSRAVSLVGLIALAVLSALATRRWRDSPIALFLLSAWACVAISWLKMGIPPTGEMGVYVCVQGLFTVMAVWLTMVLRPKASPTPIPVSA